MLYTVRVHIVSWNRFQTHLYLLVSWVSVQRPILYCVVIQKRLKHCFRQAFVPLVRLPPCSPSHCSATPFLMLAQALNRLPAVSFTRCFHKPWPFTMIHKLLLMYPKDCLLLEQTNVLREKKNPLLFLPSFQVWELLAEHPAVSLWMTNLGAVGLHVFVGYLSSPTRKNTTKVTRTMP